MNGREKRLFQAWLDGYVGKPFELQRQLSDADLMYMRSALANVMQTILATTP